MAGAAVRGASDFKAQELANTVWAFAKLQYRDDPLMARISEEAVSRLSDPGRAEEFDSMCIASITWAFATLGCWNEQLLGAVATAACDRIGKCKTQELSNLVWAFATLVVRHHTPLLDLIAGAAVGRISEFELQHLTNTAWAFARLAVVNERLMTAISGCV